jgi:type VI secretion system protein ImpG
MYVGNSAFLLASVLNHFFPLYTSANSFTQLVISSTQQEGVWKRWPPRSGRKALL